MMKPRTIEAVLALATLILALGPAASVAQESNQESDQTPPMRSPRGMMRGPGAGFGLPEELGLSQEQQEQLRQLRSQAEREGLQGRTNLQLRQMELEDLMEAEEPNEAAIQQKLREVSDARHALEQHRITQRLAMRRVLTREQYQKWQGTRRQFGRRMMGRGFGDERGFGRWGRHHRFHRGPGRRFGPGHGFGPGRGWGPGGRDFDLPQPPQEP